MKWFFGKKFQVVREFNILLTSSNFFLNHHNLFTPTCSISSFVIVTVFLIRFVH